MTDSSVVSKQSFETAEDERPEQFKLLRASLHAERDRVMALAQDWQPSLLPDNRDLRSPQLLGETLLRMQKSLGALSSRQDMLELVKW